MEEMAKHYINNLDNYTCFKHNQQGKYMTVSDSGQKSKVVKDFFELSKFWIEI